MPRLHHLIAVCLVSTLLTSCASNSGGLSTRDADKAYINASIGPVNHTSQFLYGFTVNGQFGANARAYGADIASTCCVRLPRVWRPGLTIDIRYDLTLDNGSKHNWKTKKGVPVEPYTEPGSVYVHFFPDDQIRVVVTNWAPNAAEHPIPFPVNPNKKRGGRSQ
ncbi:DUF3304 domain-containing protein [Cupriavidus sp. USMAA2-4]|uniref:DUF3304 domain-containing protein n=1 Tax=Cupriavidus sp. USMAA2-4 TaxID=876364 RepID=UPI0018DECBC3|nr:DUF3304 domain-containing protein [Cupriavidus sp. USMAA2-4]